MWALTERSSSLSKDTQLILNLCLFPPPSVLTQHPLLPIENRGIEISQRNQNHMLDSAGDEHGFLTYASGRLTFASQVHVLNQ